MKRILFIHSSLAGADSVSTRIARSLIDGLARDNPGSEVTRIDLSDGGLPHLDAKEFESWSVSPEQRNDLQVKLASRSDTLIEQLTSHDTLVLAVPMYNLGIPSTLKAWIDRVARAGKTFAYSSDGPRGLVEGVHAYLVFSRGGTYRDTAMDTQTPYMKSILGLMGITEVDTIFAEGLNQGGESRQESIKEAMAQVRNLLGDGQEEREYAAA